MKLRITVNGVAYDVDVEVLDAEDGFPAPGTSHVTTSHTSTASLNNGSPAPSPAKTVAPPTAGAVTSPIAGNVVELKCSANESVTAGQPLLVIEAMKMNTTISAPAAGTIKAVKVAVGDAIREGQVLVEMG